MILVKIYNDLYTAILCRFSGKPSVVNTLNVLDLYLTQPLPFDRVVTHPSYYRYNRDKPNITPAASRCPSGK